MSLASSPSSKSLSDPYIHETARVAEGAKLGPNVAIGAYSIVGPEVVLDEGVTLHAHVVIEGRTHIGSQTTVFPFAVLGQAPQSFRYKGESTELVIGARCTIREHVTLHLGTEQGGGVTRIGDDCFFMVASHVAHDCQIGNHVIMANNATLGGHVSVGDYVNIGGLAAVHQFVRIGKHAMIGGMSGVEGDVIPYGSVMGDRARLSGLNIIGLKRRGFSRENIHGLRRAYRLLFSPEGTLAERILDVSNSFQEHEAVVDIVDFIKMETDRSLCVPKDIGL